MALSMRLMSSGLVGGVLLASLGAALAAEGDATSTLTPSQDGQLVINARHGVAWSRCVEGMAWSGKTCIGKPLMLSHAEATALAAQRSKTDQVRWRVPRVTDLQRLVKTVGSSRGLDPRLFPAAPAGWYWVSSARIDAPVAVNQYNYGNVMQGRSSSNANQLGFLHGWAVNVETGEARDDVSKREALPVRLVRPYNEAPASH